MTQTRPGTAPAPGGRPKTVKPLIDDGNIRHNLDLINQLRAKVGAPALSLDPQLNAYALAGSQELLSDHVQHNYSKTHPLPGNIVGAWAENQSYVYGWPLNQPFNGQPPAKSVNEQIDDIVNEMWAEGPGGSHHDNIANPKYRYLGVGLVVNPNDLTDPNNPGIPASYWRGALYLTNDFTEKPLAGNTPASRLKGMQPGVKKP
jgi:hypothetical protein